MLGKRKGGNKNIKDKLWIKNSLFRRFLVIVILLLVFMTGSYGLTTRVVKNLIRKNSETSNEKFCTKSMPRRPEFATTL